MTTRIEWSSNIDGALGLGGSVLKALSVGTHVVSAAVTDSQGLTGSSEIAVTVAPGCVRGKFRGTARPKQRWAGERSHKREAQRLP